VERCRVYYKGEGGGFPQVRAVVSLVCPSCPWFILAPKVFQLRTNHLVLVLCRPVWVSEAFQFFLVPPGAPAHPSTPPKCSEPRNVPRLLTLPLFFIWDWHLNPSRSWECNIRTHPSIVVQITQVFCLQNAQNRGKYQNHLFKPKKLLQYVDPFKLMATPLILLPTSSTPWFIHRLPQFKNSSLTTILYKWKCFINDFFLPIS
jgi:hypothetical protein